MGGAGRGEKIEESSSELLGIHISELVHKTI
jgi:hypothetical protein